MSLELITGNIGSGKTLFAVSSLSQLAAEYDVIYTNIDGLNLEFFWDANILKKVKKFDLDFDKDSMIEFINDISIQTRDVSTLFLIDEASFYFPNDKKLIDKDFLKYLAYSRHYSDDFLFICQNPAQLHYQIRHLISSHRHLRRRHGLGAVSVLHFDGIEYDLNDTSALQRKKKNGELLYSRWFLNKLYYDAYVSSLSQNSRKQKPWKILSRMWWLGLIPAAAFILYYYNKTHSTLLDLSFI